VDLIIANAGISAGSGGDGESEAQVKQLFATNIDGVLHTIQPLLPAMIARRHGQIAIISSLAGLRGLATSPAYCASKACVRIYGEGLRPLLAPHGVQLSVVCPGFIRTPMTDVNPYFMPFMMEAEAAAARIAQGLARNQARIAFPRRLYWPLWWMTCLPVSITDWFLARLPAKPSGI
jgi:short-subunit dehydrogenase